MFDIKNELDGFRVYCNGKSIISQIPSEELCRELVEEFKQININWNDFDGNCWIVDNLEIHEAFLRVRNRQKQTS